MSKTKLLSEIDKQNYDISFDDDRQNYNIALDEESITVNQKSVNEPWLGHIYFQNNKIVSVVKNWNTKLNSTDIEDLNNLFTLFNREIKKGNYNFKVKTKDYEEVDVKFKVITFTGKNRIFQLFMMGTNIQVVEILGKDYFAF